MEDRPETHTNNGGQQQPVEKGSQRFKSNKNGNQEKEIKKLLSEVVDADGNKVDFSNWKNIDKITTKEEVEVLQKAFLNMPVSLREAEMLPLMVEAQEQALKIPEADRNNPLIVTGAKEEFIKELLKEDGKKYKAKKDRQMVVFLGFPASGKSSVVKDYANEEKGFLEMDSDIIKNTSTLAPWYKNGIGAASVARASADALQEAISDLAKEGYNMVVPLVSSSPYGVVDTLKTAKRNGYSVRIIQKETSPNVCAARLVKRYLQDGRLVGIGYLRYCKMACPKSWGYLYDNYLSDGTIEGVKIDEYQHI